MYIYKMDKKTDNIHGGLFIITKTAVKKKDQIEIETEVQYETEQY